MKTSDSEMLELLARSLRIAVLGISPKEDRPSHHVSEYLIEQGYEIFGVNPGQKEILNRPCYGKLSEIPGPIDLVDVFRASEFVAPIVEEVLAHRERLGIRGLWLQEGVTDPVAEERARSQGLVVVSDRCILKEHRRLKVPPRK